MVDGSVVRSFLIQLARLGGEIARKHQRPSGGLQADRKGRGDYVTQVDRRVEEAIATRIAKQFPEHRILGEEFHQEWPSTCPEPCWIIDPIDGTTNFMRGLPGWAISIAFCDANAQPRHAAVYDPQRDELFLGERGAGLWLNEQRVQTTGCQVIGDALVGCALPFRDRDALDDVNATVVAIQRECEDLRRCGSAALDLAYVACGRFDAYWELGVHPWDTAAGELLVRCGGGQVSDFNNQSDGLLNRRSVLAAASPSLHQNLLGHVGPLAAWLERPPYVRSS